MRHFFFYFELCIVTLDVKSNISFLFEWASEDVQEWHLHGNLVWLHYMVRGLGRGNRLSQKHKKQNPSETMGLPSVDPESL